MRWRDSSFLVLLISFAAFGPARTSAAEPSFQVLASFDEMIDFQRRVDGSVLLDVRPRADYDAGHVPNAIWVDIQRAEEIAARPGGLTDRDAWLDWIAPLGLYPGVRVQIMDGARQLDAARVWFLLRYLGVEPVGLINGNFPLWKAQRREMTREVSERPDLTFPVDFQRDRLATRDDVLNSLQSNDAQIIDARSIEEWAGTKMRSKRGGHIPTACRIEWSDLVDQEGKFLPRAKLQTRFNQAGLRPGEPVITHCQSGGRASLDAFVAEMLGYPTRNYYMSWSDWGNADDTPITTNDQPAPETRPSTMNSTAAKPFVVEYDYKCQWGHADEFLSLFERNHLPILRERMEAGDILKVTMTKPRIHTGEATRWDYRVTIEFKDAASAFNIAADEPIKLRMFPDQKTYRAEEQRRFAILESHTDLPIEEVDLDKPVTLP